MKGEGLGAVVIAVLVTAGCGSDKPQVHSQAAQQVRLTVGPECSIDYKTLATASEAYWAMTGGPPQSQGTLVGEGLLFHEIDDFDLIVNDHEYQLIAVGECAGFDPTDEVNCGADLKTLQTAWEAYNADTGHPPASQEDLVAAGLIRHVVAGFDLVGGEIVVVPGVCE